MSPSAVRAELLAECLPLFAEMRELARAHFGEQAAFILSAVDEYETASRALAGLGDGRITEDRRDGEGACPACDTPITKFHSDYWLPLCGECDKAFMETLRTSTGPNGERITEDRPDEEGVCQACGTPFTKFRPVPHNRFEDGWTILCQECAKPLIKARMKLGSSEGFDTWAI
ncbi:Hypothetical protein A7982_01233 [Minicystis rosea]|nr:Hypothetical protein A7982_01233 [Minicystis rosea]